MTRLEDTTVPFLEELREARASSATGAATPSARGPANALRFGIGQATADVVVVTMADGSDDPMQIDQLTRLVERGVVVACASRYMRGGQQVGGPWIKGRISRHGRGITESPRACRHSRRHQLVQGIFARIRRACRHRLRCRLRTGDRAGRQGPPPWPAGGGVADDLARPCRRDVELQGQSVDPAATCTGTSTRSGSRDARTGTGTRHRWRIVSRVLVTGSAGFIGGYVVEGLLERGHEVVGVDNEFEVRAGRPLLRQPSGTTGSSAGMRVTPH